MTRRAKPPMDIVVQSLSTADAPVDVVQPVLEFLDDFEPEVMIPFHPEVAQQRIAHAKVMTDYKLKQRALLIEHKLKVSAEAEHRREMTEVILSRKLGILPVKPSEPTLAHNQIKLGGHVATIKSERKPWRRL